MQQKNGLDKNQLISFLVFSFILMISTYYFQNNGNNKNAETKNTTTTEKAVSTKENEKTNIAVPTSTASIQNMVLKNNELSLEFSTLGGQLTKVQLNQYKAYNQKTDHADLPLNIIENKSSNYGFVFKDNSGKTINTKDLVFSSQVDGNQITFTSEVDGTLIQFVYTLLPKYKVDFKVSTKGLTKLVNASHADFVWDYDAIGTEKGRSQEQTHTEFSYAFNNYQSYDYDGRSDMNEEKETLNWIGVKQQFFASVIEANQGFKQSKGFQEVLPEGKHLKKFNYNGQVELNGGEMNQTFSWYFLPLDLPLLESYNKNFDEILPLGWSFIGSLNRWFFMWLYKMLASWGLTAGWVIFCMTIAVKLILSPIMYKQHKLSAMMKVIRPEIEEVNAKFKNADPMKKQQEVMSVYRKAGVNQLAGCLPALLQVPIFYALFRFFPNFIDLRGKSFWFVKDLTAYDDLIKLPFKVPFFGWDHISILALACTMVILIYTIMTSGQMQQPQQEGMPNMKVMMYIFPITFFFFLNSAASGLSWYYFVSNAINIIIILVIRNFILDEKKIHAQIQLNKAKPKKEGKFQKRMREMMEQAQEQQKRQQKKK